MRYLISMSILIAFLAACTQAQAPMQMPPPGVTVIEVQEKEVRPQYEFVGRTEAVEDVVLQAQVEGYLTKKNVNDGDYVQEGQVLFEIDSRHYQNLLDASQAELARAKVEVKIAQRDFERKQELVTKKIISESEMDEVTNRLEQAKATVLSAEADVKQAELNLSYCTITSPITGRVGAANVSIGDLISPGGDALTDIITFEPMRASFVVSERRVVQARKAYAQEGSELEDNLPTVKLRLSDGSLYEHDGRIDFIDNRVDRTTGSVRVRAEFPNKSKIILPGYYVTVILEEREARKAITIPTDAISQDQQGHFVMVVKADNTVERRSNLVLGGEIGFETIIEQGLGVGERVIVMGLQKVSPGITVQPTIMDEAHDAHQATKKDTSSAAKHAAAMNAKENTGAPSAEKTSADTAEETAK